MTNYEAESLQIQQLNFPANISNYIDESREVTLDGRFITGFTNLWFGNQVNEIGSFIMPIMSYGVIKKFASGILVGSNTNFSIQILCDGKRIPTTISDSTVQIINDSSEKVNLLSKDYGDFQDTHIVIRSKSVIKINLIQNQFGSLEHYIDIYLKVFFRFTGWYYGQ